MSPQPDPFRLAGLRRSGSDPALAALDWITAPEFIASFRHGDLPRWLTSIESLPPLQPAHVELKSTVRITGNAPAPQQLAELEAGLRQFIPWRKGPYELFGVKVDSEWRSDMKWDRLVREIEPLAGKRVLDVGCGNGYHCWRALGENARLVIGVEPYLLYVMQFLAIKRYLPDLPCYLLPVSLERLPVLGGYFDTVLSMGVLYHVRSPMDHLLCLKQQLAPDGQLVLETLVVDGEEGYSLTPKERYARMGNVWFVPSVPTVSAWLHRCGFHDIRLVDVSVTGQSEQCRTDWMPFESLIDGLDPNDNSLTIEGLPAPRRAIVTARHSRQ